MILLEDVHDPQEAVETAERILDSLGRPLQLRRQQADHPRQPRDPVVEPGKVTDADELIRNADAAMYIAKAEGKGGYRLFERRMHDRVVARLELAQICARRSSARSSCSITSRWSPRATGRHAASRRCCAGATRPGLVPPLEFIPFAEESGLIVDIGRGCSARAAGRPRCCANR